MARRHEEYLDRQYDRLCRQLVEWLRIPSISTLSEHQEDVARAANWLHSQVQALGFPESRVVVTAGYPLVVAEWLVDPGLPTILIYGHYDVQPVDPLSEWDHPPFEPVVRGGCVYARGASDDKAQIMLVLAALEAVIKVDGAPGVNLKLLFEGEEEAGGEAIAQYVPNHRDALAADAVLIADTHMVAADQPSLINGLRGIVYTEVTVSGARSDLHSGSYGGVAPNPLQAICQLFGRLKNEQGQIDIPQLAAHVPVADSAERAFWQQDPLNLGERLKVEMGVPILHGDQAIAPLERLGARPTLELHGIRGGFVGEGAKTVIPATATAKASLRLPPELSPETVFSWFQEAVHRLLPAGYDCRVRLLHSGRGILVEPDNHYIRAAAGALRQVYGREPVLMREGGSIPVAALLAESLAAPVVLMGFGLPDDGAHAPNEKFSLGQFRLGMRTVVEFLERIVKQGGKDD